MTPKFLGILLLLIMIAGCGPVLPKLLPVASEPTALPAAASTLRAPSTVTPTPPGPTSGPTKAGQATNTPSLSNSDDGIRLAQQKFPVLQSIKKKPAGGIGASADIIVQERAGGWNLIFWQGSGDCPAGCIDNHYWYVAVETSGSVTLRGEYVRAFDNASNAVKVSGTPLWGVPGS